MPDDNTQQTTDTTNTSSTTDTQQAQNAGAGTNTTTTDTPIMNEAQLLERLERARKTEREKVLKGLGYEDEKTAQAALKKAKDLETAALSETERQTKALADAEKKATDAQARITELETTMKRGRFESAILKVATDMKAKYPHDVVKVLTLDAAFSKWLEADDPDEKAIKAWVEAHKKERPDYFTNGNGTPGSPSNRNAAGNPKPEDPLGATKLFKF